MKRNLLKTAEMRNYSHDVFEYYPELDGEP